MTNIIRLHEKTLPMSGINTYILIRMLKRKYCKRNLSRPSNLVHPWHLTFWFYFCNIKYHGNQIPSETLRGEYALHPSTHKFSESPCKYFLWNFTVTKLKEMSIPEKLIRPCNTPATASWARDHSREPTVYSTIWYVSVIQTALYACMFGIQ